MQCDAMPRYSKPGVGWYKHDWRDKGKKLGLAVENDAMELFSCTSYDEL